MVVCVTPPFAVADLPPVAFHMDGQGEGMDLSVTVEAAGAWMPLNAQHRNDPSTQVSCITNTSFTKYFCYINYWIYYIQTLFTTYFNDASTQIRCITVEAR